MCCSACKNKKKTWKVFVGEEYLNVKCKVVEDTFKNRFPSGISYNGHLICLFKCAKGYFCWIEEGNREGSSWRGSHTKVFQNEYDAICNARLFLEDKKDRQLKLF